MPDTVDSPEMSGGSIRVNSVDTKGVNCIPTLVVPQDYDFKGNIVRAIERDGEPWFVARDIGAVLGLKQSATSEAVSATPDQFKDFVSIVVPDTKRGHRNYRVISYEGATLMIMRSRKPQAEAFQLWLATEVVPSIRKHGYYFEGPKTNAERLLAFTGALHESMKELVVHERRIQNVEGQVQDVDGRVQAIEQRAEENKKQLLLAERSDQEPREKSTRMKLVSLVRNYCLAHELEYKDVWKKLYTEFRDRYHVDLKTRGKNSGKKPLDIAEELGVVGDLFSLASRLCRAH